MHLNRRGVLITKAKISSLRAIVRLVIIETIVRIISILTTIINKKFHNSTFIFLNFFIFLILLFYIKILIGLMSYFILSNLFFLYYLILV